MRIIDKPTKLSERIVNAVALVIFDHFKDGPLDTVTVRLEEELVAAVEEELAVSALLGEKA